MTKGRKSIFTTVEIRNSENPKKPHIVEVQANKNYGICDMSPRVGEILSDFQGRQLVYKENNKLFINDAVVSELEEALETALNPEA